MLQHDDDDVFDLVQVRDSLRSRGFSGRGDGEIGLAHLGGPDAPFICDIVGDLIRPAPYLLYKPKWCRASFVQGVQLASLRHAQMIGHHDRWKHVVGDSVHNRANHGLSKRRGQRLTDAGDG